MNDNSIRSLGLRYPDKEADAIQSGLCYSLKNNRSSNILAVDQGVDYILKQPEGELYISYKSICKANLSQSALIMSSGMLCIAGSFALCSAEDSWICITHYK